MASWCHVWILNFDLKARTLYEAVKGSDGLLQWTPNCRKGFGDMKRALMNAPALGLLDLTKPFALYMHERLHIALGVLTHVALGVLTQIPKIGKDLRCVFPNNWIK